MLLKQLIVEKLGNLKQLNVGPMINILKQSFYPGGRRSEPHAGEMGKRFGGQERNRIEWHDIGSTSKIVDGGVLKKGLADIRKAYRDQEVQAKAFALYVDGKAIAFGKFDQEALGGSSRMGILAFDLEDFAPELMRRYEEKKTAEKNDWMRSQIKEPALSSYVEKREQVRRWNKKNPEGPDEFHTEKYQGQAVTTAKLKDFIDEVIDLARAQGSTVTFKLVLKDTYAHEKRSTRGREKTTQQEIYTGLEALKARLAKHKISKKPSARDIHEFLQMAARGIKIVQFAGHGYQTDMRSYSQLKPETLLKGQPFEVNYSSVDPGHYGSVEVTYSFDPSTGTLVPFKAKWQDGSGESQVASLEPNRFLRSELNVKDLNQDSIIKAILTKMKDGHLAQSRNMINAARKAGHDYPEFKAIEKSIATEEQKKKQQSAA